MIRWLGRQIGSVALWLIFAAGVIVGALVLCGVMAWEAARSGYAAGRRR